MSKRTALVKQLDSVFSLYIRKKTRRESGPNCVFCKTKPIEDCFHFITRSKHKTRWDEHNATASCRGCNFRAEHDLNPFIDYFIRCFGAEKYSELVKKSNGYAGFSQADLKQMIQDFKTKLEDLN